MEGGREGGSPMKQYGSVNARVSHSLSYFFSSYTQILGTCALKDRKCITQVVFKKPHVSHNPYHFHHVRTPHRCRRIGHFENPISGPHVCTFCDLRDQSALLEDGFPSALVRFEIEKQLHREPSSCAFLVMSRVHAHRVRTLLRI